MSDDKSYGPISSTSSPRSKVSMRTHRQVSCLESQYASLKSKSRREQDQSEIITHLAEELKQMRMRESNLKRINNTLMKALQTENKNIQPGDELSSKMVSCHQTEVLEEGWRLRLEKEKQANEQLRSRLQKYEKLTEEKSIISEQQSQKSVQSRCSSKTQRQQSVKNMQQLMDSIIKDRCSIKVDESWKNTTVLVEKSQNHIDKSHNLQLTGSRQCMKSILQSMKAENQPADINELVMHLANQKIETQLKIKQIEGELSGRDLSKKQREMLEASLRNLRKNAKCDQYQEYLKDKIIKEIDRYSTRVVMNTRRPR